MGTEAIFKDEITVRDRIAIKSMLAIIRSTKGNDAHYPEQLAKWSYSIADSMLKQREL